VVLLFRLDGKQDRDGPATHVPWVYVDELDAHFAHAKAAGAAIVSEIQEQGHRAYEAEDLERRRWTFVQARPTTV
jgi:uncharacterized glyoxalase superfamily protein PhnB